MKTITLDNIEWIESPNYYEGRTDSVKAVVGHWWDDPSKNPQMSGVISHFQNPAAEVSAHFVVSGDRVVQMVSMADTAWHARAANPYTVGIEIDPNTPGNTYETVGALVKFIRGYYGDIPLKGHRDYVSTSCPGTIDLGKIDAMARGTYVAPAPVATKPTYKVIKDGKQIGAYTVELNAYNSFVSNSAQAITLDGADVTASLVAKYAPAPVPATNPELDAISAKVDANTAILNQILELVKQALAKLTSIFK